MCGRYEFAKVSESEMVRSVLEELHHRKVPVKTGTVLPGDLAAVIASSRVLQPQAFGMAWGYRLPDGKRVFNARSETAARSPLFSDGMRQRRCIIPADWYYEWEKTPKGKQKYRILPAESDCFLLAGIYRIRQDAPEFSILTQEPVQSIRFIHDRMPVILPHSVLKDWLDPTNRAEEFLHLQVPGLRFSREEADQQQIAGFHTAAQ